MSTAPAPDPTLQTGTPSGPGASRRADAFFSWTAGIGMVRGEGWLAGVAAGLAARLRVDPLIIRAILVVVGLFGFPVLVLYGLAWALLPDLDGRIPLQEAVRGRFTSAQVGAALCIAVGLVAWPVGLWVALGGMPDSAWGLLGALLLLLGLVVAGALVVLIVRASLRTAPPIPGALDAELRTASADSAAPAPSDLEPGREPALDADARGVDAAAAADTASLPAPSLAAPSAASPSDGTTDDSAGDELAAWRAQHAAWKEQDQLWRQQQQDAARAARDQARRERQARATAFAAEAAERRRIRRATSPRTPFAYVAVVVGLAVVVGTVVALQQGGALAPALGLFTAAAVLAGGMVIAGAIRRRSGFLAFATVLALLGGAAGLALPVAQSLHVGSYGISNTAGPRYPASAPFAQPWGDVSVLLADTGGTGETFIDKRSGSTYITIEPGVELTVEVTTRSAAVYIGGSSEDERELAGEAGATTTTLPDGRMRTRAVLSSGDAPITTRETVVLDQESGYVDLYLFDQPFEGVQP